MATLEYAISVLMKTHPTVEAVGLGSLAPASARDPRRVIRIARAARKRFPDKWVHVFGVGNSVLAALALEGSVDSVDTASHIVDAKYGKMRDPDTLKPLVVTGSADRELKVRVLDVARKCSCPSCRLELSTAGEWGRRGVRARAVHNAFWMLRAASDPTVAQRYVELRPYLARELRRRKAPAPGER